MEAEKVAPYLLAVLVARYGGQYVSDAAIADLDQRQVAIEREGNGWRVRLIDGSPDA